jgi:hypothetical protein
MRDKAVVALLLCAGLWSAAPSLSRAEGATCIAGGCHETVVSAAYLHGPVAAEEAGADGCVSCHVPAGASCTAAKAGRYKFKTKADRLCLLCHERGTGTQHTRAGSKCLSCHSPHGSESSSNLMRAGG